MNIISKKFFKYTISFFIIFIFLITSLNVFAASITYNLKDIGVSLTVPEKVNVITRENKSSDDVFNKVMSYDDAQNYLNDNDIYLIATSFDFSYSIELQATKSNKDNDSYLTSKISKDTNNTDLTTYEVGNNNYYMYQSTSVDKNGVTSYEINATILKNGQEINYKMISNAHEISDEEMNIFNDLLKSVEYSKPTTDIDVQAVDADVSKTDNQANNNMNVMSIIINLLISIIVLAIIFAIVIYVKTKKRNEINVQMNSDGKTSDSQNTFIDDFYDEISSQHKNEGEKEVGSTQNLKESKKRTVKPIRLEIEVPADKIRVTRETKRIQRKLEEEKDSVVLTDSNNEDFDEIVKDEIIENGSKKSEEEEEKVEVAKKIEREFVGQDVIVQEFERDDYWNKYR